MKTIPELLGYNAEHSEQKSIVFETKLPKNVWGMVDMNGVININKDLTFKPIIYDDKKTSLQIK